MHRDLAVTISQELLACSGKLDRSVTQIQGLVDDEAFETYRYQVGEVMGLIYIEILREIYKQYPDLEPESFR